MVLQDVFGEGEEAEVGEGEQSAAVHEAAAVHVLLLGPKGAEDRAVRLFTKK
jgi:hypothetical protein